MNHATQEQLNDYLDGTAPSGEREELRAHVDSCPRCLHELNSLRETLKALGELPRRGRPRRDLWPSVAARTVGESPVVEISTRRPVGRRPGVSLSLPQAVAAAALIAILAGGTVWLAVGGASRGADTGAPGDGTVLLVATQVGVEEYDRVVADLTGELNRRSDELDPEMLAAIQANLEIIDAAILEINEALGRDPDNDYLNAYLARAMRKKVDVLRQASLVRARL